jgi:hypothetical protein
MQFPSMNDLYNYDKTRRRYSYFAPLQSTSQYYQDLGVIKTNTPKFSEKESFEVLHHESVKIKEFLQKVFTNEKQRRHSHSIGTSKRKFQTAMKTVKIGETVRQQLLSHFNQEVRVEHKKKSLKEKVSLKSNFKSNALLDMIEKTRKLQRIEKVNDSEQSDDELVDIGDGNMKWILLPESILLNIWESIIFVCLLYIMLIDTYIIGFIENTSDLIITFSVFIDFIFVMDFIFNFFRAYYDINEELVTNRKKIIMNYLNNGFVVDLITSIPFSSILNFIDSEDNNNANYNLLRIAKVTRLSKLSRVLKFTKLAKAFQGDKSYLRIKFLEELNISSNVRLFAKSFVYFLLFNHLSTCIWVFISRLDYPNWITDLGLQDINNLNLYINGLYFNLATVFTIGYGDIHAVNIYERLYNTVLMVVGVLVYSFAISSISNIVIKTDKKEKIYRKRLELLEDVRKNYLLDNDLYRKLSRHLFHDFQINRVNKTNLLDELPMQLRYKLVNQIYKYPINNLKFFKNASRDFINRAVVLLRQIKLYKNEYVIKAGNYLEEMYFVKRGKLSIFLPINIYKKIKLLHMFPSEQFGEIYMCKRMRCPFEIKVGSKVCELYCLWKMDFIELGEEFPKFIHSHIKKSLANTTKIELIAKDMILKMKRHFIPDSIIHEEGTKHKLITMMDLKPAKGEKTNNLTYKSDKEKSNKQMESKVLVPRKSVSHNTSPLTRAKIPVEVDNQHLQLINFNTKDIQDLAIIEKSETSNTNSSFINSSKSSSDMEHKDQPKNKSNQMVLNINNTINPQDVGGPININYNINIQNNLNIDNYLDKVIDCVEKKPQEPSEIRRDSKAQNKTGIRKVSINEKFEDRKSISQERRVSILKQPIATRDNTRFGLVKKTIIRQNNIIDENPNNESFSESIRDAYEKNAPEVERLTQFPLFGFFKHKLGPRKSEQHAGTDKSRIYAAQALYKNKRNTLYPKQISSLPILDKRSASIANLKRMSEHHFYDIIEQMKKDAMLKKNPNILNSRIKKTEGGVEKILEQQIDRITEIFETMLIAIAKKKGNYHE